MPLAYCAASQATRLGQSPPHPAHLHHAPKASHLPEFSSGASYCLAGSDSGRRLSLPNSDRRAHIHQRQGQRPGVGKIVRPRSARVQHGQSMTLQHTGLHRRKYSVRVGARRARNRRPYSAKSPRATLGLDAVVFGDARHTWALKGV